MLWEMYQLSAINSAARQASSAESTTNAVDRQTRPLAQDISRLESRIDALALGCQSLWELLCDRTDLTHDGIVARMQEVDLRDARADGRIRVTVTECPACKGPMNSCRPSCLYCGEVLPENAQLFDK